MTKWRQARRGQNLGWREERHCLFKQGSLKARSMVTVTGTRSDRAPQIGHSVMWKKLFIYYDSCPII